MSTDFLFHQKRLLSQRIGQDNKFLAETACMNREEREMVSYIEAFSLLFHDPSLNEFIKPLIAIGRGKWGRDIITDLGLLLGDKDTESEDVSEI